MIFSNDKRDANLICAACFNYRNQQLVTETIARISSRDGSTPTAGAVQNMTIERLAINVSTKFFIRIPIVYSGSVFGRLLALHDSLAHPATPSDFCHSD
jgi:hypothetical protein